MLDQHGHVYVIHRREDGSPWLILWKSDTGWELDDGVWVLEVEPDSLIIYMLEETVAGWERCNGRAPQQRVSDVGELAREVLRRDLARYRPAN